MTSRRLFWNIVDKIELLIDQGVYSAGSRLPPERELAEMYDVSRPTIREAIIALEVRERVEVKTSSGVYVTQTQRAETGTKTISAFELTQARALVEGEAAALAAQAISNDELLALKNTIEDMQDANKAEAADQQFHEIIARATRNGAVLQCVEDLWRLRRTDPFIIETYQNICSGNKAHRITEHAEIYAAIAKKDAAQARRAMHKHFDRLINALFDASEAKAMEEIKRKTDETRDLYSLAHLRQ